MSGRWWAAEDGMVGGVEVLPFGFLVFVVGTLLLANAWAVVDGKLAVEAAAREAARTYVESPGPAGVAFADARRAAADAIAGHGRDPGRMDVHVDGPLRFERCAPAAFVVSYRVPTLTLPWIGGLGSGFLEVNGRHREVVDPYREGVPAGDEGPVCGG